MNMYDEFNNRVGNWCGVTLTKVSQLNVGTISFICDIDGLDAATIVYAISSEITFPIPSKAFIVLTMLGLTVEELQNVGNDELDLGKYVGKKLQGLVAKQSEGSRTWFYLEDIKPIVSL